MWAVDPSRVLKALAESLSIRIMVFNAKDEILTEFLPTPDAEIEFTAYVLCVPTISNVTKAYALEAALPILTPQPTNNNAPEEVLRQNRIWRQNTIPQWFTPSLELQERTERIKSLPGLSGLSTNDNIVLPGVTNILPVGMTISTSSNHYGTTSTNDNIVLPGVTNILPVGMTKSTSSNHYGTTSTNDNIVLPGVTNMLPVGMTISTSSNHYGTTSTNDNIVLPGVTNMLPVGMTISTSIIMSSATSAITYTSVYTNSEPDRAFWGADDEEVSEGGIPRVIVLGYDGLPKQPVAPLSPDYIPGPENPQTPPVPQDEDEREPMFVQAHNLDYVPEPIYPEYIPLEDDHEFPAEEQPLPLIDSPTAESPRYVTESDLEEDPEEYKDDETEDGPVDYLMDGGDDRDDDDSDSSRDDANDEDEDDKDEEEEEEHLASADSAIVVLVDEPLFPPEGTELVIPPPSTNIILGARITV
ncbi:hypothetical protein Tco_1359333 [Tanacetum coccineum]